MTTFLSEMNNWLRKNEHGRYTFLNSQRVYLYYDACRLQRSYLRFLQRAEIPAVIAGSYAAMQHQYQNGGCSWSANDIDIWVFRDEDFLKFQDLYEQMVLCPMRLRESIRECSFYHVEADQDNNLSDQKRLQRSRNELKEAVSEWCSFEVETLQGNTAFHSEADPVIVSVIETLPQTTHQLPARPGVRPYRPIRSVKIKATGNGPLSLSLLPINLIQVENVGGPQGPKDAAFICSGFDLSCCCVALNINDDHTMETLTFEGAGVALANKMLQIQSVALANCIADVNAVPVLMRRIVKYLERSFRWPLPRSIDL